MADLNIGLERSVLRRLAAKVGLIGFLVLALVGWWCDVPVHVCAMRAAIGAGALLVMTLVGGKILLGILVDTVIRGAMSARERDSDT